MAMTDGVQQVQNDVRRTAEAEADAYRDGETRPIGGYVVVMAAFAALLSAVAGIALATGLTVALLYASGLAWTPVSLPNGPAFLQGMAVGIFAVLAFAACQSGLWWLANRPNGPETRLIELAQGFTGRLRSRVPG